MNVVFSNFDLSSSGINTFENPVEASPPKTAPSIETDPLSKADQAIRKIRKERLDNPQAEIERLIKEGFLSENEIKKLDLMFGGDQIVAKAQYAEALAVRKTLEKTHYVFLHAQSTAWSIFTHFIKELVKKNRPDLNVHQYKFLRSPQYFEKKDPSGIEIYKRDPHTNDGLPGTRDRLISVDGYFYNRQICESTYHFLTLNSNISNSRYLIETVLSDAIRYFYPEASQQQAIELAEEANGVLSMIPRTSSGNLFVVCIPKDKDGVYYRAHAFGVSCDCHPAREDQQILEKLQKGECDGSTTCSRFMPIPQFRLYAPALQPDGSSFTYLFSPFSKKVKKSIKGKIKELVDRIDARFSTGVSGVPRLLDRYFGY